MLVRCPACSQVHSAKSLAGAAQCKCGAALEVPQEPRETLSWKIRERLWAGSACALVGMALSLMVGINGGRLLNDALGWVGLSGAALGFVLGVVFGEEVIDWLVKGIKSEH